MGYRPFFPYLSSLVFMCAFAFGMSGCRGAPPNIERPKGQIEFRRPTTKENIPSLVFDPATSSLSKSGIDVTIRYAAREELDRFFENKEIFGEYASKNPYPPETLIFYVKIANHSGKKIRVNPDDFVLIDNLNIQYAELSPDNISALYESKANVWTFAKATGDLAPGPYGMPLKVASSLGGGGGRKLHYLMKQVRLAAGTVYDGIAYDGYVAFPHPHPSVSSIRVLIANVKTEINAADEAIATIDFDFPLTIKNKKS